MAEAPFIGREAWPAMQQLYKVVGASNARRQTSWPSVDEAMAYLKKRAPVKVYHPEVWRIMSVRMARCTSPSVLAGTLWRSDR